MKRRKTRRSYSVLGEPVPLPPHGVECRDFWHTVSGIRTAVCPSCQSSTAAVEPLTADTVMRSFPPEHQHGRTDSRFKRLLSELREFLKGGDDFDWDDGGGGDSGSSDGGSGGC